MGARVCEMAKLAVLCVVLLVALVGAEELVEDVLAQRVSRLHEIEASMGDGRSYKVHGDVVTMVANNGDPMAHTLLPNVNGLTSLPTNITAASTCSCCCQEKDCYGNQFCRCCVYPGYGCSSVCGAYCGQCCCEAFDPVCNQNYCKCRVAPGYGCSSVCAGYC